MPTRLAFLGPVGTYGEQAARVLIEQDALEDVQLVPCVGLRSVVEQLAGGQCDAAVVPIENSVEGGVTATLDALWSHPELCIRRALVLPIQHALLGSGPLSSHRSALPPAGSGPVQWLVGPASARRLATANLIHG